MIPDHFFGLGHHHCHIDRNVLSQTLETALNQVIHLWGYENLADMEARRAARDADPAWEKYLTKTAGLILSQETKILKPTSFSPIR